LAASTGANARHQPGAVHARRADQRADGHRPGVVDEQAYIGALPGGPRDAHGIGDVERDG
jgi:hypothetical protein